MPIRTVVEYFKRWGYTPQKLLKRADSQEPDADKEWLEQTYPEIKECAQTEGVEIAWAEESGLLSNAQVGRGYAPMGKTPKSRLSRKKWVRVNFIASISNQGSVQFMLYTSQLNGVVSLRFLNRLICQRSRKLFWIVDRHPIHRAEEVQQWLAEYKEQIEMFYLPSYSPHLNPAEYFSVDVKQGVYFKPPTWNLAQLKQRVISHLRKLQNLPSRVEKYFEPLFIAYVAQ